MAEQTTKRRVRRAAKQLERQRRRANALRNPVRPRLWRGIPDPPPLEWFDDPEGGAGVREPRRPFPGRPGAALELEPAKFKHLHVASTPLR